MFIVALDSQRASNDRVHVYNGTDLEGHLARLMSSLPSACALVAFDDQLFEVGGILGPDLEGGSPGCWEVLYERCIGAAREQPIRHTEEEIRHMDRQMANAVDDGATFDALGRHR
jgi:hypothetical protein